MHDQQIETVEVPCTIIEEDGTQTETTVLAQLGPEQTAGPGDTLIDGSQRLVVHRKDIV